MAQILGWTVTLLALGVVLLIARLLYDLVVATALVAIFALGTLIWSFLPSTPRRVVARVMATLALILLLITVLILGTCVSDTRLREAARSRIAHDEVLLQNLQLFPTDTPGWYRLTGTVQNLSPTYTLTSMRLDLTVEDCLEDACTEIGRGYAEIIRGPGFMVGGQIVPFTTNIVRLPVLPMPQGTQRLQYTIARTEARE